MTVEGGRRRQQSTAGVDSGGRQRRATAKAADSDGGGQQRWGQRSTVARDDDISYPSEGGSNANIILLSIVALSRQS